MGKKNSVFTLPGLCRIETQEAGNQGWEERDLWQAYDGEGQAGKDCRQGVRSGGAEESILMLGLSLYFFRMVAAWLYTKCQCKLHTVSTGMTGPWSVHGRAMAS